ncbi:MAG: bifunctional heptose 7-phosphate kinase/heptose 1-phosphate adenyltransferase [Chitinophagales bacterium]
MSDSSAIINIFKSFERLKVLIIGDVMVDSYIFGNTTRISPEAPIPIVDVYKKENRLGGAANVALNVKELGATPLLCSVVGDDYEGHTFKKHLQFNHIDPAYIILDQERKTTVKTRVVSRNAQLVRFDSEQCDPIDTKTELLLIDNIIDILYRTKPHVVILQDYNKGVLTPKVIASVIYNSNQMEIPVAVDPKKDNFFLYKGCTLFKPNLKEASDGLATPLNPSRHENLTFADQQIRAILNNTYTIITLSERGIFVGMEGDSEIIPAYVRNITDVSGAGDTVISMLSLGLALGLDIFATVELANIAAGMVCEKVGVVAVDRSALLKKATAYLSEE